jgi:hypothetical protein
MNKINPSTVRATSSRKKLIDNGGERFEVRLSPATAANRKQVMSMRKIKLKTELMDTLLEEETNRLRKANEVMAPNSQHENKYYFNTLHVGLRFPTNFNQK